MKTFLVKMKYGGLSKEKRDKTKSTLCTSGGGPAEGADPLEAYF